jgi:hypothetical protein
MSTLKVNTIQAASGGSVTITGLSLAGTGIVSSSVEGDAQGQIKLNGVNVDINALGSGDAPQFTTIELGHASDTTLARASSGDVNIEGNLIYRAGGTDVPVADGGTGASSLTDGGILLGSGTDAITAMAVLGDGEMIVGDGSGDPVAESGATLRTSIGVGTGDSPQFTGIELGHASDTTLTRASSGDVNIEGNIVYRAGGTDVPVTDGGTGASSLTDGGVLLGSGTGAITAMAVLADGEMIVGDGTTDPVAESGATLRTSIGVGTGDSPQFTGIELGHASDTTLTRASSGVLAVEGVNVLLAAGNAVVSASAEGDGQGQIKINGVNVNTNALGTGDSPSFTNLTVTGDLTVAGTRTELQVTELNVEDKNITLASGSADSAASDGAGLTVAGASATFTYTHSGTKWNMNKPLDMDDNTITTTGAIAAATLNTGQGANELYAMDQDVQTSDSPQFAGVNVGHASDTTLTRASAGDINVEGNLVYRAGGTDVPVADGGTGASSLTDGGVLLGSGTSAITAMAVLADGEMIVGDGSGDPVAESGATLRTSIGVGTGNDVQFDSFGVGTAASGTTGEIRATNDITAFYSSDGRLKENIVPLTGALNKVKELRGVSFDWKELNEKEKTTIHSHEGHDIGVIAQEIQAQYPELVTERENGYLAVDYVKLTAVLLQAIKELDAKVEACMAKK